MRLPRAVLLDLDDTIIDDSGSSEACWREACALVAGVDGVSPAAVREAIERERSWFWSDAERHRIGRQDLRTATRGIVERALEGMGLAESRLALEIADRYRDLREARACLVPGALDTLRLLQERGVRLGLMTNGAGAAQRAKIERFGLAPYFGHILIEGEFGVGKPFRMVYETLLSALGAEPRETWAAGDNLEWDVGAPQRLGMRGIWVDVEGRGLPAGSPVKPDAIVRSIAELI